MTDAARTNDTARRIEGDFDTVHLALDGLSRIVGEVSPESGVAAMLTIVAEKVDRIRDAVLPLLAAGR